MNRYLAILYIMIFLANPVFCPAQEKAEQANIPSVIKSSSSMGEVTFPHQLHFEDFEFECKSCHHETNAAKLNIPHDDYFDDFWIDCKTCHHKTGSNTLTSQACSNCHHILPANIADETLSSKTVIHKSCWECHEVGKGKEASQSCKSCHAGAKIKF